MRIDYIKEYTEALMLKNYCQNTINCYCGVINKFLSCYKISPERISETEIKSYILKYDNSHTKAQIIGALKIFYAKVVKQPLKFKYIDYPRKETKLPIILSKEEVAAIYSKIVNMKHKAIFILLYSTGMRVGELINLKPQDIDSSQMIIRIISGKGHKDRIVPLSENCLSVLRIYWKEYKPKEFLFNGQFTNKYTESSIRQWLNKYRLLAGIKKDVYPHLLRHCNATHLLEQGTDIAIIQDLLGHKNPKTTQIYRHISTAHISKIITPDMIFQNA